jgi:hypothetical protein
MREKINSSDFVYTPKSKTGADKKYKFYCIFGEQEFIDDDNNPRVGKESPKALAKLVTNDTGEKYYVKTGTYGRLYNPIGLYSEGQEQKFLSKVGKNAWEFTEVNSAVFTFYVNFLRTKNIAWLNNAEREYE